MIAYMSSIKHGSQNPGVVSLFRVSGTIELAANPLWRSKGMDSEEEEVVE